MDVLGVVISLSSFILLAFNVVWTVLSTVGKNITNRFYKILTGIVFSLVFLFLSLSCIDLSNVLQEASKITPDTSIKLDKWLGFLYLAIILLAETCFLSIMHLFEKNK